VGDEPVAIVREWVQFLARDKLLGPSDPLFPRTEVRQDSGLHFAAAGLSRHHWETTSPIRRVFKEAFIAAGLPYFKPHSFRDTLTQLAERRCSTPEEFKAWSQNLGHEQVMTTFTSYGAVPGMRQAEIMRKLTRPKPAEADLLARIAELANSAR
jgi:integrase